MGKKSSGGVIIGLLVVILGVLFLLANFGMIPYSYIMKLWPLFVIFLGLALVYWSIS